MIARRLELPPFEEIRAATLDGLLAALAERDILEPVFADLSLGAWRSHELAQSVFGQLRIAWPLPAPPAPEREELESSSVIGDWIDSEGRGDAAERSGLFLAEELFGALNTRPLFLVLLVPRFGLAWRAENTAFLRYLAHGVRAHDRIVLATIEPDVHPPHGLSALVPGVIDPETAQALGADGHLLSSGWLLVAPESRRDPRATSALDFDRLAAAPVEPWLRAFAHVHGNNYFVDPWFLCAEATRHLAGGGHEIALQLMERAAACAPSPDDRASLRALLQGFQIALMRYDDAAAAPDPSPALSPLRRGPLLMTKGWGLVMLKQAQRAEPYMQAARELLAPILGRNRQFLYLLNISALNRVNLGDMDGALAIEKDIEKEIEEAAESDRDYRLQYVNSINLARLYRRRNDFDLSSAYYARAFATTEGARTESDLVYTNACIARLDSARGRHLDALLGWLRASLHWLSSSVPEALGWRVLSAVCGAKVQQGESVPLENVARSLNELLRASAQAAGVMLAPSTFVHAFIRADRISTGVASAEAIGAPGFSVFSIQTSIQPAQSGPEYKALAASAAGLMASLAQAPELQQSPTILVDDRLGREMATNKSELLSACLRLEVKRVRYNGEAIEPASFQQGRVALGPAVAKVDRCVHFKRYLPPRHLSAAEADLLAQLDAKTPVTAFDSATIRALEADRVLEFSLDPS